MKTVLHQRPSVSVVLLDSQRKPLRFTAKRLAMLQEMQVEFPEIPVFCEVNGQEARVELQLIELWNMNLIYILNTSVA